MKSWTRTLDTGRAFTYSDTLRDDLEKQNEVFDKDGAPRSLYYDNGEYGV